MIALNPGESVNIPALALIPEGEFIQILAPNTTATTPIGGNSGGMSLMLGKSQLRDGFTTYLKDNPACYVTWILTGQSTLHNTTVSGAGGSGYLGPVVLEMRRLKIT